MLTVLFLTFSHYRVSRVLFSIFLCKFSFWRLKEPLFVKEKQHYLSRVDVSSSTPLTFHLTGDPAFSPLKQCWSYHCVLGGAWSYLILAIIIMYYNKFSSCYVLLKTKYHGRSTWPISGRKRRYVENAALTTLTWGNGRFDEELQLLRFMD